MSYTNGTAALKMPSSYVLMNEEEMMYTEGGYVDTQYGTAKLLKARAREQMLMWSGLATSFTAATAATAASGVGVPVAVLGALSAAYFISAADKFGSAYTYFSCLSQTSSKQYKMQVVSFAGIITGVNCSPA